MVGEMCPHPLFHMPVCRHGTSFSIPGAVVVLRQKKKELSGTRQNHNAFSAKVAR
jgi:hypothetical protein